jgi:2-methylcitrate dehydratase PrpD
MTVTTTGTTRELASFLSDLRFEDLPREVVDRTEELFLDWIASALAGRSLVKDFGERWAVLGTSFKFHASCRHTHPAADALLQAMREHHLAADRIAHVHEAAIDVLGPVTDTQTIHQSKFSMGFVLALIALYRRAGVTEFTDEALRDPEIRSFADRVEMVYDTEIDAAYPERWIGLVEIETTYGEHLSRVIDRVWSLDKEPDVRDLRPEA